MLSDRHGQKMDVGFLSDGEVTVSEKEHEWKCHFSIPFKSDRGRLPSRECQKLPRLGVMASDTLTTAVPKKPVPIVKRQSCLFKQIERIGEPRLFSERFGMRLQDRLQRFLSRN